MPVRRHLAEADDREVPERRHRPTLDQADIVRRRLHPAGEALPREIGLPAELARHRLEPALEGEARAGLGTDAVRTLAIHLIDDLGHHRLTIDPAADNAAAIRAYEKVGFRAVGLMRRYERGSDGTWHDNLLMDLLADELTI